MRTQKSNVGEFNADVAANGGYRYTTNAPFSSEVANLRMTQATVALIPKDVKSILDVGCGDGTYTAELKRSFPNAKVVGLDPASEAINRASRLIPSAQFQTGDLLNRDTLPNEMFDICVIRGVIHHLPDAQKGIVNAARLCKTLIIIEPNGNNPILKWIEKNSQYHIDHEEQSYSSSQLLAWCESTGARKIAIDYVGFIPFFFPTPLAKIIYFFQPLFEKIYPLKKYFSAQIVVRCDGVT